MNKPLMTCGIMTTVCIPAITRGRAVYFAPHGCEEPRAEDIERVRKWLDSQARNRRFIWRWLRLAEKQVKAEATEGGK